MATIFGQGLAGPKAARNSESPKKGEGLIFPCHGDTCRKACRRPTLQGRLSGDAALSVRSKLGECCKGENPAKAVLVPRKGNSAAPRSP